MLDPPPPPPNHPSTVALALFYVSFEFFVSQTNAERFSLNPSFLTFTSTQERPTHYPLTAGPPHLPFFPSPALYLTRPFVGNLGPPSWIFCLFFSLAGLFPLAFPVLFPPCPIFQTTCPLRFISLFHSRSSLLIVAQNEPVFNVVYSRPSCHFRFPPFHGFDPFFLGHVFPWLLSLDRSPTRLGYPV